jgi:hypothetical protein
MALNTQPQGGLQMATGAAEPQQEEAAPQNAKAATQSAPDPIQALIEKKRERQNILDEQIAKMQAALEKRTQPMFDPKALRMLKEATRPTATGHFLESLGNIAGGYGEEQTAEINRDIETQKQKYELLAKQQELGENDLEQQAMLAWLTQNGKLGSLPQAPATGRPMAAQRLPVDAALDKNEEVVQGGNRPRTLQEAYKPPEYVPAPQGYNGTPRTVTSDDYKLFSTIAPKFAARLKDMDEFERKGQIQTPEGIWDDRAKRWSVKFNKPVETQFAYVDGPQKTMTKVADAYDALKDRLDRAVENKEITPQQAMNDLKSFYIANGIRSSLESEREKEQMKADIGVNKFESEETIKERNAANKVAESDLYAASKVARQMRNTGESVFDFANNPKTSAAFGQFATSDMLSVIGTAISGLNIGDKIPLEKIAAQLGRNIPRESGESTKDYEKRKNVVLNAQMLAASRLAELEIHYSQGLKGQGQVSNNERRIVEKIGPQMSASPLVVALKAQMVIARANFDERAYKLWGEYKNSHPKGTYNDFVNNDPMYKRSVAAYDEGLKRLEKHAFPTQEKQ